MKRPIGLWVFWIIGLITDILGGILFYFILYIPLQRFLFTWFLFLAIVILYLPFLIIVSIEFFRLKKWAKDIFFMVSIIMNIVIVWYLSVFPLLNIISVIFLLSFIVYFLNPSVRRLFKE